MLRPIPLATLALLLLGCPDKDDTGPGTAPSDVDGDGYTTVLDCDDSDPTVNPGATEVSYDGLDNDCDPDTLDDDLDQDGHGALAAGGDDCDDADPAINPSANEVCNGVDDDCNGAVDDNAGQTWYADGDGDSWGDPDEAATGCDGESGYVANDRDCDDGDDSVHPGATETCDGVDQDCDGVIDDNPVDGATWYTDGDGDGWGDDNDWVTACTPPLGTVDRLGDCNDAQEEINPDADEVCDYLDNDCDGFVDEGDAVDADSWYIDADGDGYGDPDAMITGCTAPSGAVASGDDCDDGDATIHPGATEIFYDGVDQDCAGDDDLDADGDGARHDSYGGGDCDDTDATIHPGATEVFYDGVDQDCDGLSDYDADLDGFDSDAWDGDDCDDADATVYPGAPEVDGTVDNDCDGEVEEMPDVVAAVDGSSSLRHCEALLLDGTGSSDPEGTALSYLWTVVSVPAGSTLDDGGFDDPTSATPTIYPDSPGTFVFGLTVTDEGDASASTTVSATVVIRTRNSAPVASAGSDATIAGSVTCVPDGYSEDWICDDCDAYLHPLDGTGSTDADGEPLSYQWTLLSGTAVIRSSHALEASLYMGGPSCGYGTTTTDSYTVELEVTDCYGDSSTDIVVIDYACTGS